MNQNNLLLEGGAINEDARDLLIANGVVPADASPKQIAYFFNVCNRIGADPFNGEASIVAYTYGGAKVFSTIIQKPFYLRKAAETGELAGIDDPKFDLQPDGSFKTAAQFKKGQYPTTCTITVYRVVKGIRAPFTVTVRFDEYAKTKKLQDGRIVLASTWASMPFTMITKVATVHAFRAAFSDVMPNDVFVHEELGAMKGDTIAAGEAENANVVSVVISEEEKATQINAAIKAVKSIKTVKELADKFKSWPEHVKSHEKVIEACRAKKAELTEVKDKLPERAESMKAAIDLNELKKQIEGKNTNQLTALLLSLNEEVQAMPEVKKMFRDATAKLKKK